MNKSVAQALMSLEINKHLFPTDELPKLREKIVNIEKYCTTTGCYELRKPKHPNFPQSRYCVVHARIAKENAKLIGRYTHLDKSQKGDTI